jgi:pimeloyl-ACP methyl ester carboxylesterase
MEKVLLIHGMFMNVYLMAPFVNILKSSGYEVRVFGYPLIPNEVDITTRFIKAVNDFQPNVIVGHSLGGTITIQHMSQFPSLEKVVCLGSPLNGSLLGRTLSQGRGSWMLPKSIKLIATEGVVIPKDTSVQVGIIAGTDDTFNLFRLASTFRLFGKLGKTDDLKANGKLPENDGVVLVSETKPRDDIPHTKVFTGHTGLIFSKQVHDQTISFLKESTFLKSV